MDSYGTWKARAWSSLLARTTSTAFPQEEIKSPPDLDRSLACVIPLSGVLPTAQTQASQVAQHSSLKGSGIPKSIGPWGQHTPEFGSQLPS